ncbi:MAG: PfkB family carbohydrate kinase [Chloroflexota bacterium]
MENSSPDLLLIGHVTQDLLDPTPESDYRLGGTVSFAAITALRLERKPTILTRAAPHTRWDELPDDVDLTVLPSPETTTFANVYSDEGRTQYCFAQALPIQAADVPRQMQTPNIVLLGPLVNEIHPDVASLFGAQTLTAAVPQGWMRRWDETGRVYSIPWETEAAILPYLDILVLSEEDVDSDLSRLESAFKTVPIVVLTEYRDGSTIYRRTESGEIQRIKIPPRPALEVDPTGAGDVFATAFIIRYQETGDPIHSARFANVTASFGVEAIGISGIPSRQQVLDYLNKHPFRERN